MRSSRQPVPRRAAILTVIVVGFVLAGCLGPANSAKAAQHRRSGATPPSAAGARVASKAGLWGAVNSPELASVSCPASDECIAVGDYTHERDTRPLIERWNGSSWQLMASPRLPDRYVALSAVSCPTTRFCVAVGQQDTARTGGGLAEVWNGISWKLMALPTVIEALNSVSCGSPTACVAVGRSQGTRSLVESWDGSAWELRPGPHIGGPHASDLALSAVSCEKDGTCVVSATWAGWTGRMVTGDWSISEIFELTPSGWMAPRQAFLKQTGFVGDPGYILDSLSCVTSFCEMVGRWHQGMNPGGLVESQHGGAWALQDFPGAVSGRLQGFPTLYPRTGQQPIIDLQGVSCTSERFCLAVGSAEEKAPTSDESNSGVWDGHSWRLLASPAGTGGLSSVSCVRNNYCVAVGDTLDGSQALGELWRGEGWIVMRMPEP